MPEEKKETKKKKTTTTKKKTNTSKSTSKKRSTTKKPTVKKEVKEKVVEIKEEVVEEKPVVEETIVEELREEINPKEEEVVVEEEIKTIPEEEIHEDNAPEEEEIVIDEEIKTVPEEEIHEEEVPIEEIHEEKIDEVVETVPDKIIEEEVSVKDFEDEAVEVVENTVQAVADTVNEPVKNMVSGDLHKKPSIIIYLLILFCIAFMVLVGVFAYYQSKIDQKEGSFIYIDEYRTRVLNDDYYIVSSEEELNSIFPKKEIQGTNFDEHNYVILEIPYDPCGESDIKLVGYHKKYNTLDIDIEYEAHCDSCSELYLYYLLELDKNITFNDVKYRAQAINNANCPGNRNLPTVKKPIIYLYPEKTMNVSVKLGNPELLAYDYPSYNDGWNVTASPNGTLKDSNNREYYALFWEGKDHKSTIHDEGFVVKGEESAKFLEKKLKVLGLTDKEANEFIIYWLPQLENSPYNYFYFETQSEIDNYMPLIINPTPDTVIRIQMDFKNLDKPIKVKEQKLLSPKRNGFTVVEWGGSIIKD